MLVVVFAASCVHAQQPKPEWITVKSANLKCWECKERLDRYLLMENRANMENGMMVWKINLLQGEIKIQFLPDRTSASAIKAALNNAGFDADNEAIDLLRYKQFLLYKNFTDKEVLAPDFLKKANETFKHMRPVFDYMSEVLTTDVNGIVMV